MSPVINALMTKCRPLSTEQLVEMARELNLKASQEEILVASAVANILEERMPANDFIALMEEFEAELMAA